MQKAFVILSLFIFGLNLSCTKNPVTSENPSRIGRRDYIWTEDTIKIDNGDLSRLWGSDTNSVWAVGSANAGQCVWHYDGKKWSTDSVRRPYYTPWSIFGFCESDVWMGASNGNMWHYDGNTWNLYGHYEVPECERLYFLEIWGESKDDIYAIGHATNIDGNGYKGIIMHYSGEKWEFIDIPDIPMTFIHIRRQVATGEYFIYGFDAINLQINKIYSYHNKTIKEIYSGKETISLESISGEVYFVIGEKIYKHLDNKFVLWKDFTYKNFSGRIWGRSETDCFNMRYDGIGHYNGIDLQTLYKTDSFPSQCVLFDKEVFFLGNYINDNGITNVIIHGKLKGE